MSGERYTNKTDVIRTKMNKNYEKLISFNSNCKNSNVDFRNLCLKSSIINLDDNSIDAFKNFNNAGKIINITF